MPYTNPSGSHNIGDTGHTTDHNNIVADLVTLESHVQDGHSGASAAYSLAGATASGSPGSGTFAVGDAVIDQTGQLWICTAAGTPGTWVQAGGGAALDTTTGDIQPSPGTAGAGSVGKAADAGHIHPSPAAFAPTGLTGATSASRYVGATASAAPASGTFATGDYVITQAASIYVCTAPGTPGTWAKIGQLDATASDIQPTGTAAAAGSSGKAADAGHVHVGLSKVAFTTAGTGYTLVNGTGNIISWTTPNDGADHVAMVFGEVHITSASTGGAVGVTGNTPDAASFSHSADTGGHGSGGTFAFTVHTEVVGPNTTVAVAQTSALTGGAGLVFAQIWGS